jgi:hypothetical protein
MIIDTAVAASTTSWILGKFLLKILLHLSMDQLWFVNHCMQIIVFMKQLVVWPGNINNTVTSIENAINFSFI